MDEPNPLLRVLCLEDLSKDAEVMIENLADAGYMVSVDITAEEKEYVSFLNSRNYDIILADYTLPGFDALTALKLAQELRPEVPFICVSGTIGEERAVELLKQGATDYVIKDRLGRLAFAVMRALEGATRQKEWKRAEDALKESEEKFRVITENSADAIFVTDNIGRYVYVNTQAVKLLGYSKEELLKFTIADIIPKNKVDEYFQIFQQIIKDGSKFAEIELIKKDGSSISSDLNGVMLPNGLVFASCRDITGRKRTEYELIKAKEQAEKSDRLKSAFLANMSHEIRTPMNGILGFAGLLKEPGLKGEDQQMYIKIIEKSGARMLNIINDIVDISKIESGLMEVNMKETNINEQLDYIYTFFKPEVEGKGMQLFFKNSLPSKESNIKTDREKLYAILTNLVKNAVKYSEKGSIGFGYEKRGKYLEFFVKDTGIGIPKNRQKVIFERFIQADIANKHAYQGAGLGLSISKAYVEMLGGKIRVESEEGRGSIFYFTLPYQTIQQEENITGNSVSSEIYENNARKLKILVAEDDETSEMLISVAVQNISKRVLKVTTGADAVDACRNNPDIDLVLMDIQMPVMNGYEATRQIRQFNKDVIIIAQTAYGLAGDKEKAIDAGCNDYIPKPLNLTLLKKLIQKYFNKYE